MRNAPTALSKETGVEFDIREFGHLIEGGMSILSDTIATDRRTFAGHVFETLRQDPGLLELTLEQLANQLWARTRALEVRPDLPIERWLSQGAVEQYRMFLQVLFVIRNRHAQEQIVLGVFGKIG